MAGRGQRAAFFIAVGWEAKSRYREWGRWRRLGKGHHPTSPRVGRGWGILRLLALSTKGVRDLVSKRYNDSIVIKAGERLHAPPAKHPAISKEVWDASSVYHYPCKSLLGLYTHLRGALMPVPGLALVGFMNEQTARSFLVDSCAPPDASDAALLQCWNDAKAKIGASFARPGQPSRHPIPVGHEAYLDGVKLNPRFDLTVLNVRWEFKLVEIEPLLAFQFHVETDKAAAICANVSNPPTLEEMLKICLPHNVQDSPLQVLPLANGLLILSPDPNVVPLGGATNVDTTTQMRLAGAVVGENSPLVHVIHCNGRYYLSNGYHRAYGLSKAGATHMPCIVIHTDDYGRVGAVGGGGTFDRALLESPSPPTIAHFKYDRAYPVSLRTRTRFIQVTWSTYVMPDRG